MKRVYFDNAATTPLDEEVLEAMLPYMKSKFGNPSAVHGFGRETRAAIEKARKTVANYLNCSTGEIFFTSGGTESNNQAIKRSVYDLGVKHIITSTIEHHSVAHSCDFLEKDAGVKVHYVNLDELGRIDYYDLESKLTSIDGTKLVSLMHANNELGNVMDLQLVSELCEKYGTYLHSDTVQTVAHFPIDLQRTRLHFMSGSAHKFHGPKGEGFIYINSDVKINPTLHGGGQERNMRSGTENVYGIVGLGKAVEIACDHKDGHRAHITDLKMYMAEQLQKNVPGVKFMGDWNGKCLYTVLSVCFPESDKSSMLLFNLDIDGIACSAGSACASGTSVGSHVIGQISPECAARTIRFSFSKYNNREEVDYVVEKLKALFAVTV